MKVIHVLAGNLNQYRFLVRHELPQDTIDHVSQTCAVMENGDHLRYISSELDLLGLYRPIYFSRYGTWHQREDAPQILQLFHLMEAAEVNLLT
jgi:hypothetical protein